MTKKITAIFLALCMAISVLPMTIQAASKPDIKVVFGMRNERTLGNGFHCRNFRF